ncbi:MAG: capsular biosynthesis protein CpsI, partial [Cyanobium sp.]
LPLPEDDPLQRQPVIDLARRELGWEPKVSLEQALGREAIRDLQPMQPGDVPATAADTSALEAWVGFRPTTAIETGVERFAGWYRDYFGS